MMLTLMRPSMILEYLCSDIALAGSVLWGRGGAIDERWIAGHGNDLADRCVA